MARVIPRVRLLSGWFLAFGVLLAIVASSGAPVAHEPSSLRPTGVLPTFSSDQSGSRSVLLEVSDSALTAGSLFLFSLVITYASCVSGSPGELIDIITFSFGDGFQFPAPGPSEPSGYPSCSSSGPWNQSITLSYAYRNPGTYVVSASVLWQDGSAQSSNTLTVSATSSMSTALAPFEWWFFGTVGISGAALAVCFVLRRLLPASPFLPPDKV